MNYFKKGQEPKVTFIDSEDNWEHYEMNFGKGKITSVVVYYDKQCRGITFGRGKPKVESVTILGKKIYGENPVEFVEQLKELEANQFRLEAESEVGTELSFADHDPEQYLWDNPNSMFADMVKDAIGEDLPDDLYCHLKDFED